MASVTQTSAFFVFKTTELKDKTLCPFIYTKLKPKYGSIQIKNSAATDFWQNLIIWHGKTYLSILSTFN
jgi:hypothetical protein